MPLVRTFYWYGTTVTGTVTAAAYLPTTGLARYTRLIVMTRCATCSTDHAQGHSMIKRYTLRTVLTFLGVQALAGVIQAQALAPADSAGQPPNQRAVRLMDPTIGSFPPLGSAFRQTSSTGAGIVEGGRLLRTTAPSYPQCETDRRIRSGHGRGDYRQRRPHRRD